MTDTSFPPTEPPMPPTGENKPHKSNKILWISLGAGVLSLCLISSLILAIVLISKDKDDDTSASDKKTSATSRRVTSDDDYEYEDDSDDDGEYSLDNPVPLGTPMEIGDGWTLTVNSFDTDAAAEIKNENMFNEDPEPGQTFVMVNVTMSYNGSETSASSWTSFALVGFNKIEYSTGDVSLVEPDALDTYKDVFQGGTNSGNISFSVPSDEVSSLVFYVEEGFNDAVYFSLY